MRFPRLSREDIPRILASGKRANGVFLTVLSDLKGSGDAIIVSKKVARTAVSRNRLRRVLRGALRENGPHKGAWVLLLRPGAAKAPLASLKEEALSLRAKLSRV